MTGTQGPRSPIQLRDGLAADAAALASLQRFARAAAMPWLPALHTPEEDLEFFRHHVLQHTFVKVLCASNKLLAFVSYRPRWIEHIYVLPEHWRRGLGTRLVRLVQQHQSSLQLWTFQRNRPARSFYAAMGFHEAEFTDGRGNEEHEPDVRMLWRPPALQSTRA